MTLRPNSRAFADVASLMHPYTDLITHAAVGPTILDKGKGIYVYDDQGREYIEGLSGLWCTSLGYGEEELVKAASDQMRKLPFTHLFGGKSHDPAISLAEKIKEIIPVEASKVLFMGSGSEANDTAIKLIWYYNNAIGRPEKKKLISRQKAYHGVSVATASLTGLPANHALFDLPIARILHTSCPHYYRFGRQGETPEDFATRLVAEAEALILKEGPETVAAFFAEPVMGAGGVIIPPPTYFEKLRVMLDKYDILLVADEVICGFGRTGNMFGSETFNIKPDIMTMAKALSSAYLPIAAMTVPERMFDAIAKASHEIGTFGHGNTYSGHPVCAAVALRTIELMEERQTLQHVKDVMGRFQSRLQALSDHPLVGEARGIGLIGAIELSADKQTKTPFDPKLKVGPTLAAKAQEHGLIVRPLGGDVVAICPPLIITEAQIDDLFNRLEPALAETLTWVRDKA
jgi:4-aminobutyrate--pyruvate transaminase